MKNKLTQVLIGILAVSSLSMAQPNMDKEIHPKHDFHHMEKGNNRTMYNLMRDLNLTDAQIKEMNNVHDTMRKERQEQRESRREAMQKLMDVQQFNETNAEKIIRTHNQQREMNRLKTRHAMYQILTPEQRTQYKDTMKNHKVRYHNSNIKRIKPE